MDNSVLGLIIGGALTVFYMIFQVLKNKKMSENKMEFHDTSVNYYKNIINYDSSKTENRNKEELKSAFLKYENEVLSQARKNITIYPLLLIFVVPVSLVLIVLWLLPSLGLLTEASLGFAFLGIVLISVLHAIIVSNNVEFKKNNLFIEFFNNFQLIKTDKINSNLLKHSNNQNLAYLYVGSYKGTSCVFSIVDINNNPNAVTVLQSDHSYKLIVNVEINNNLKEFEVLLNEDYFSNIFSFNTNNNMLFLVSKEVIPNEFVNNTRFRNKSHQIFYAPFLDKNIARIMFNITLEVFGLIDKIQEKN